MCGARWSIDAGVSVVSRDESSEGFEGHYGVQTTGVEEEMVVSNV
jgi:hypothetical protein